MNIYYASPNGMYQALDILAAQASARSRHRESAWPAQPYTETSSAPTRSRRQGRALLLAGVTLIVLLLVVFASHV